MARRLSNVVVPGVVFTAVAAIFSACSNDNGGGTPAAGGAAGFGAAGAATGGMVATAGMPATGGATASSGGTTASTGGTTTGTGGANGGSTGSGGATMSMDAGILGYVCEEHAAKLDPGGTGMANAPCCNGAGKCTLASSVMSMPGANGFTHDTCAKSAGATDLLCAPLPAGDASAAAEGLYATCMAQIGPTAFEGRCLPQCFIGGHPNASTLTASGCMPGPLNLVCAPCYNPVDGTPTGSCSIAPNDKPKTTAPTPYPKCGGRDGGTPLGTCVPKAVALASGNPAAPSLKQDDCSSADYVCTPTVKAQNVNACFTPCKSGLSAQYADGACVPIYVATDVSPGALAFVKQTTCGAGEVCAPCQDLLSPGSPSHACQ